MRRLWFLILLVTPFPALAQDPHPGWPESSKRTFKVVIDGKVVEVKGWLTTTGTIKYWATDPFNSAMIKMSKVPIPQKAVAASPQVYGVDEFRVFGSGRRPGVIASTPEARAYAAEIEAGDPRAGRLHVTLIGTKEQVSPVLRDLERDPNRAWLDIQDYRPEEWAVDPALGFQVNGKPTIMIQDTEGRELYRAESYDQGRESLGREIDRQLVRVRDPNYNPAETPGPSFLKDVCPFGFTAKNWPEIAGAAGLLAFLYYRKKGK